MQTTADLFETVCSEDSDEEYGQREVKQAARPYIDYLKGVQKWHKGRSVSWKVRRPGKDVGTGSNVEHGPSRRKGMPGHRKGFPVTLDGVGDADLRRIVDAAETIGYVYDYDPSEGPRLNTADMIKIKSIDEDDLLIWLERDPAKPYLKAERNTYQTAMMIRALEEVVYRPNPAHLPLRRLFRRGEGAPWPGFGEEEEEVGKWFFLRDGVEGADEQRRFVRTALATPDFAFLEGPPGSGKTTVLCELAVQMAARGRRALFCASTHVAVDNLLERIAEKGGDVARHVVPIRIGKSEKISEAASRYEYDRFVGTVKDKMRSNLSGLKSRSRAQETMLKVLGGRDGGESLARMVRDHANLVCGTTVGILGHPDIRAGAPRRFDMMILDESSKTTLQEFLVPAVHADRWVIVGDTRQLVPYTDQDDMAMHVGACIEPALGKVCLDAFAAKKHEHAIVLARPDRATEQAYRAQCEKLGVEVRRASGGAGTGPGAGGGARKGEVLIEARGGAAGAAPKRGAKSAGAARRGEGERAWAEEVSWRIGIHWHGMAGAAGGGRAETLNNEIDMLMPAHDEGNEARQRIDRVRRIAVPSVLEVIQDGFPGGHDSDGDTLLERGMPGDDFGMRHALLEWQHRMHPDIAAFSHKHVYKKRALRTPDGMAAGRAWKYGRYSHRAVWIDVRGSKEYGTGSMSNEDEARRMADEVEAFVEFAARSRRPGGGLWEVAVLPFYTGQLRLLQRHMRRLAPRGGPYTFRLPPDRPSVLARLRTVDSFQGHEADLVMLGLTNSHPTLFLANPNRLNVALTRARYQCVIFGDRAALSKEPILGNLARETPRWTGVA